MSQRIRSRSEGPAPGQPSVPVLAAAGVFSSAEVSVTEVSVTEVSSAGGASSAAELAPAAGSTLAVAASGEIAAAAAISFSSGTGDGDFADLTRYWVRALAPFPVAGRCTAGRTRCGPVACCGTL